MILLLVDGGEDVSHRFAVGRNVRVGEEVEGEIVLGRNAAPGLSAGGLRGKESTKQEAGDGEKFAGVHSGRNSSTTPADWRGAGRD